METIKYLTNKEIKNFILNSGSDLEELIVCLEKDPAATIEGITNALYPLLKNYNQNKSRIKYLLRLLKQLTEILTPEELRVMSTPIQNLVDLLSQWKLKQRMNISKPYEEIIQIQKRIEEKEMSINYNDKIKYVSFLIFQERDASKNSKMIAKLLDSIENLLSIKDENYENIFETILNKYLYLDENNIEEIKYFYEIILLFIKSKHGTEILEDSKQYFRMIKRSKLEYKDHIIRIMSLFNPEFHLSLNDLEQRYSIQFQMPNVILKEASQFQLSTDQYYDFTYQDCITIDGRNSKCLDDALYIEKNKDGTYTLYIHIVDIPSLIPYESLTRQEAYTRGETLYLSDRVISLYPDFISNQICSLLPGCERYTQTSIYKLDPDFQVIEDDYHLVKGKIKVKYRTTYEEVDARFQKLRNTSYDQMLEQLRNFADVQRKRNPKKEAYRKLQNAVEFDPNRESLRLDYSSSSNIVHESMVLENYRKAKYMNELDLPYLFRKLELPSNDFIEKQLKQLSSLDSKYVGSPEFFYHIKQGYAKSQYTTVPSYHMGIHLPIYSHSSSPARRYIDSECQYMVHDMVFNENRSDFNIQVWEYRAEQTVKHINETKRSNEVFSSHYNYLTHKKLIKGKK